MTRNGIWYIQVRELKSVPKKCIDSAICAMKWYLIDLFIFWLVVQNSQNSGGNFVFPPIRHCLGIDIQICKINKEY